MPTNPDQPALNLDPSKTWVSLANVVSIAVAALSIGGFVWQSRAVAADVATVKEAIEKKADKVQAEAREARLQQLEKFVAVQVQINENQTKANESQARANEKNEAQHERMIEKLDRALSKKP